MPHAVDVGRVEVELPAGVVPVRLLADPAVLVTTEVVLEDRALADVHRTLRAIVVVVARVLGLRPADQPDVDVRIAVHLHVVPIDHVVADVVFPERALGSDRRRQLEQLRPREVAISFETSIEPCLNACHWSNPIRLS